MTMNKTPLNRFLDAQDSIYAQALAELKNGRKQSHWMWYIFPQISGLGHSETAKFYAISDVQEARDYLDHPILGTRLIEAAKALLTVEGKTANQIMGSPDDTKLRSSMTLFSLLTPTNPVFQAVLTTYFEGLADQRTIDLIKKSA